MAMQRYRDKMRAAGLSLIQLWVPDTSARGFAAEYARQCRIANTHRDRDVDAFVNRLHRELARELDQRES
jgi:hypothetical protein